MQSIQANQYLLQSERLRRAAARTLYAEYGAEMGGLDRMVLWVDVSYFRTLGSTFGVSVKHGNPDYSRDFLQALLEILRKEWHDLQIQSTAAATLTVKNELAKLEENIREAEDKVIEYKRVNDVTRVAAKSSLESRYLEALMSRRSQLTTELMLMEAQNPILKDANIGVINDVADLTRETGQVPPVDEALTLREQEVAAADGNTPVRLPENKTLASGDGRESREVFSALLDKRIAMANLQLREKELAEKFKPEHPELVAVRKEIERVQAQLDVAAQVGLVRVNDRHKALRIALSALETAEYNWKARDVLATERQSELKRLQDVVQRYDSNYRFLYEKLHNMVIAEELKADLFRVLEPPKTNPNPVWPDPMKILLTAIVAGLGSGLGLAILANFFDNKVQTIRDVESELGLSFLGGIPYWADSGLETTIRPIVTEEHSVGAVEAYRSLRTMILSAMAKEGQNILMFTSADAKEGKTLTTLNIAVMTAQMDKRVLLIDMDLRRGRLHKSLGFEKEPGMTDVLKGRLLLDKAIVKTQIPKLDFLPTGATVDNAAELLHSANIKATLDLVKAQYDYVFVDTSPVLRVTDTVILASQGLGPVVFVTHINKTPKPMIRYALSLLKDASIVGTVINGIEMHKISSLYYAYQYPNYAYYSNAYRYGYDYYDYGDAKGHRPFRRGKATFEGRRKTFERWFRHTFLPME